MIAFQIRTTRDSLRFRWSEWVTSGVMILWGYTVLVHDALSKSPGWDVLVRWANDVGVERAAWGWFAAGLGFIRIAVLVRNGRWRHGPSVRIVLAWTGSFFWACLVYALWLQNGVNTGSATYIGWLVADFGVILIASYDSKRIAQARRHGLT